MSEHHEMQETRPEGTRRETVRRVPGIGDRTVVEMALDFVRNLVDGHLDVERMLGSPGTIRDGYHVSQTGAYLHRRRIIWNGD